MTHLNYQEKISGPPELTPYFNNGTNKVLSWVLLYICLVSFGFLTSHMFRYKYAFLIVLSMFSTFHPSLHPYTAVQQPRCKIHRSAQLFTLRFVGLCLSVNYIFLFLLLLILLYTLLIYFLLDLFVVYSFVFYLFSLGGAWRCKKRLAFVLLGLPIFFRIFWVVTLPETHSSLAGKIYHFDGIYQERNWDFPWVKWWNGYVSGVVTSIWQ